MNILLFTILLILIGIFFMNLTILIMNMIDYIIEEDKKTHTKTYTRKHTRKGVFDVFDPGCFFD